MCIHTGVITTTPQYNIKNYKTQESPNLFTYKNVVIKKEFNNKKKNK